MKKILIFLVISINSISLAWADLQDGIDAYADQNFDKAIKVLTPLANKGDSQAQFYLGLTYSFRNTDFYDTELGDEWLEKSAHQGNIDAQFKLGDKSAMRANISINNFFDDADEHIFNAINWLTKASNQGDIPSSHLLADLYSRSPIFLQQYTNHCSIAEKITFYSEVPSYYLGLPPLNFSKARELYQIAALDGYPLSQYFLARIYQFGIGGQPDANEAKKWYSRFINAVKENPFSYSKNRSISMWPENWINDQLFIEAERQLIKLNQGEVDGNFLAKDLLGVDHKESNLSGIDLSDIELANMNFEGAYLCLAKLSYTRFSYSNLSETNLSGANLSNAEFINSKIYGTNFSGANLMNSSFVLTKHSRFADFTAANLSGANLRNMKLDNLRFTNLKNANLMYTDLSEAELQGADLSDAITIGAKLDGAIFCNTIMPDGTLNNSDCNE